MRTNLIVEDEDRPYACHYDDTVDAPVFVPGDSVRSKTDRNAAVGEVLAIRPRVNWGYIIAFNNETEDTAGEYYADGFTKVIPYDAKLIASSMVDDALAFVNQVPEEHRLAVVQAFVQELTRRGESGS